MTKSFSGPDPFDKSIISGIKTGTTGTTAGKQQ
jgi:hypothetical protein